LADVIEADRCETTKYSKRSPYENVGVALEAQGKLQEALETYEQSSTIFKRLAEQDKTNSDWQRNLSISYEKVGDVLAVQGKLQEALGPTSKA
jgi:tetratricopeptide (TPR) repeat protein